MKDNRGGMKPTARKVNGGPQMMMNDWQMNQPQAMACNTNHVVPVVGKTFRNYISLSFDHSLTNYLHPIIFSNPTGFPRSAFEAVHDESSKFRQLPCRTLISVGVCPYREKCKLIYVLSFILPDFESNRTELFSFS